jgi:hypothetical protein
MIAGFQAARNLAFFVLLSTALPVVVDGQDEASQPAATPKPDKTKRLRWGDPGAAVTGCDLIQVPTVQKELKLTDKQKKQVLQAYEQQQVRGAKIIQEREEARRAGQPIPGPIPVDTKPTEAAIIAALSPDQRRRFQQIRFQHAGVQVFRRDDVARTLNLSDDQRLFVKSVLEELSAGEEELLKIGDDTVERAREAEISISRDRYEAVQAKVSKKNLDKIKQRSDLNQDTLEKRFAMEDRLKLDLRQKAKKAIVGSLTRRQRENFDKMLGTPFDFTKMPFVDEAPEPEVKAKAPSNDAKVKGSGAKSAR